MDIGTTDLEKWCILTMGPQKSCPPKRHLYWEKGPQRPSIYIYYSSIGYTQILGEGEVWYQLVYSLKRLVGSDEQV